MARIKQQRNARAGMLHEQVQFGFGLDRGSHVVVIGQRHPLTGTPFAKFRHVAAIDRDLIFRQFRLLRQGFGPIPLDRPCHLAINDARRTRRHEQVHLRADPVLVLGHVAIQDRAGKPTAADRHAVFVQYRAQLGHGHRKPPARLHASITSQSRLPQTFIQRHIVGQFDKVVIPPADR